MLEQQQQVWNALFGITTSQSVENHQHPHRSEQYTCTQHNYVFNLVHVVLITKNGEIKLIVLVHFLSHVPPDIGLKPLKNLTKLLTFIKKKKRWNAVSC